MTTATPVFDPFSEVRADRTKIPGPAGGAVTLLGASAARTESAIALDHLLDFMPAFEVDYDNLKRSP